MEFCNTYFKNMSLHTYTRVVRGRNGGKEHDRSGAVEEEYAEICAVCEDSKRNGTRPIRSHVVLCKVRLVGAEIERREVVVGARRIRSEKEREHQYKEGYSRSRGEESRMGWRKQCQAHVVAGEMGNG